MDATGETKWMRASPLGTPCEIEFRTVSSILLLVFGAYQLWPVRPTAKHQNQQCTTNSNSCHWKQSHAIDAVCSINWSSDRNRFFLLTAYVSICKCIKQFFRCVAHDATSASFQASLATKFNNDSKWLEHYAALYCSRQTKSGQSPWFRHFAAQITIKKLANYKHVRWLVVND